MIQLSYKDDNEEEKDDKYRYHDDDGDADYNVVGNDGHLFKFTLFWIELPVQHCDTIISFHQVLHWLLLQGWNTHTGLTYVWKQILMLIWCLVFGNGEFCIGTGVISI